MTARTLKQVAQAGLVLGFEWIAMDKTSDIYLHIDEPKYTGSWWSSMSMWYLAFDTIGFPDIPPEQSLLKLRDIVDVTEVEEL